MEENTPPVMDDRSKIEVAEQTIKLTANEKLRRKIIGVAQDIFMRYSKDTYPTGQWDYNQMQEIARYYLGRQDPRQYSNKWDKSVQNKGAEIRAQYLGPFAYQKVDDQLGGNLQILNHVITTMVGNMKKQQFDFTVNRNDSDALNMREDIRIQIATAMELKALKIRFQTLLDEIGSTEEELPLDDFALRKRMENLQLDDEYQMQCASQDFLDEYNFKQSILDMVRLHTLLFGMAEIRVDWMSKRNKLRATVPYFRVSGYTQLPDCSDSPFDAELIFVSLNDLKYEAEGQIRNWESVEGVATTYQDFYNRYNGMVLRQGSGWAPRSAGTVLDAEKGVVVLDFVYKRTERVTINERKLSNGRTVRFIGLNHKGGDLVAEKAFEHRYGGKWIVSTDEIYQWGRILPSAREFDGSEERQEVNDFYTCRSGFIAYRPMALTGQSVPPAMKAIELVNAIQQLWVKTTRQIKRILPTLVTVDRRGFKQLIQAEGGKGLTPMDVATSMVGDGFNLWDSEAYPGTMSLPKGGPVQVQNTEDIGKVQTQLATLATLFNLLREMMAVPPQMNGVMPGTRTGEGVSDLMIEQAQVTMIPYYEAIRNVVDRTYHYILMMLKYSGRSGNYNGVPYNVDHTKAWRNVYKAKVTSSPTDEQKKVVQDMLQRYVDAQMLDPDTVFQVLNATDVKEQQLILIDAVRKARKTAELANQYQFQTQEQIRKNAIADNTDSKIAIDKSKVLAQTQQQMLLENQKSNTELELEDQKQKHEMQIMLLEDSQIDEIAQKVVHLLSENKKAANDKNK